MMHYLSRLKFIFIYLLAAAQVLSANEGADSGAYTVIPNKAATPILTPSMAGAKTIKIRLKNGLEAYLVSDPNADQSSAAMVVRVGSWEDPAEHSGLAHFNEHMLFLGTKKYPKESEYDRFIVEHGGSVNAFTADDYTAFAFAVNNEAFEEALDRFSNFFKEPLFNPSGVARELQAIDQEYAKNIENDDIREMFIYKELAAPDHPFHAFSMGNRAALSSVSQNTLKEWYRTHYSANLMRLVVISPAPLEELIKQVVNDFEGVPTNNRPPLNISGPIFSKEAAGKIAYIEPVKNLRRLTLVWDLPAKFSHMQETRPEEVVCYVMGHEGQGSLLAQLKKEKLALGIQCGGADIGPNNKLYFLDLDLTDAGIEQVNTVIERVFQALAGMRQNGVPRYIFDEVQQMYKLKYQYQSRDDAFQGIMKQAALLAYEDMDTYPEYTQMISKYDPDAIKELLNFLVPQNCHIDVMAPEALTKVKPDRKERWLGVSYALKEISQAALAKWYSAGPNPQIRLPAPNPYFPKDLSLLNASSQQNGEESLVPKPEKVAESEKGTVYFAPDTRFLLPQVSWQIEVKTPEIEIGSSEKVVLGDLYVKYLTEALDPDSYPAIMAGLNYTVTRSDNGIKIVVEGYNENAPKLLEEILKQFGRMEFPQDKFKIYKESLYRDYQNFEKEQPLTQAAEMFKAAIYKNYTSKKQSALAIRKVTYDKFVEYVKKIFDKSYVQAVLYGNMTGNQAKTVARMLLSAFPKAPYPKEDQLQSEVIVLPENEGPFYMEGKVKAQGNAAVLALELPTFSFKQRASQQILMQAIDEPFFATLRTKQQTGYIVYSSSDEVEKRIFNLFAVQSNTHDVRDLLARFELFIEGYLQEINTELSEERFNKIREALIQNVKSQIQNIPTMSALMYLLAFKYDGDFEWMDKRLHGLAELQYSEFLGMAHEALGKKNKRRLAVLLKGSLSDTTVFQYQRIPSLQKLRQLSTFIPFEEADSK